MRIEQVFRKDIFRPINGVVKADQLDEASVWQELDEFVVTRELGRHFSRFFTTYCEALDNPDNPDIAGKIGVWVSGFFGSGKSHFIKVLSYLLENQEHHFSGETRHAVDFFESKITDALLFGDIKRAVASNTDVILFNIDSKADNSAGRNAILMVFLKVLNELEGFSGDYPHIAHMERYLAGEGRLRIFHATYKELTGTEWVDERDAYEFHRDQVVEALAHALGQSTESCEKWIDGAEERFSLTIENLAKWTKEYLDSRGPNHRLVFFVDEVGQFIGSDTHLMLNLQTITEELGTVCKGRAWVVVTSQEDIDAVLGEIQTSKANDFSKIQGRFKTRLSLSSANVDEVIQERLLAKRDDAMPPLARLYEEKGDIIRNQQTFRNIGMTVKQVRSAEDFIRTYPFAPYQFQLLQKIFESIRKAGATGLHLAQGERSLLDAFQYAGKAVAQKEIGVSVPLFLFYPSIESFLDTSVKRTIDHARENASLEPFDTHLLEVLFLIRYVDEMKGNIDNLVTLCLDEIDADRLALRRRIEAGLGRLEKETLISRSGDNYFFLTNEERDINREIKNVDLNSGEEARALGKLIFEDLFKDQRKHRYSVNRMDFPFNRVCDLYPVGNRVEGGLTVSVISPLFEDYETVSEARCILDSSSEGGKIIIRLADDDSLGREIRAYLKTEKYLRTKDDGTLAAGTRKVHRDLADENRARRERLVQLLVELVADASFYVAGQRLEIKANAPVAALDEALEYLIRNTFTKMGYLKELRENPLREIQAILHSDDLSPQSFDMELPENNPRALEDLRSYITLCAETNRQIVLHELINNRYANRPYGWPAMDVLLLLSRLYVGGEIRFVTAGAVIERSRVYEAITSNSKWRKILVQQRIRPSSEVIQEARQLGRDVFSEMGPDGEDAIFKFLRDKLETWRNILANYRSLADTGKYPGQAEIDNGLHLLKSLAATDESHSFLKRFLERQDELLDFAEVFHDLKNFYEHQRTTWDSLSEALVGFNLNRMELSRHPDAAAALDRMDEILADPNPYGLIHETDALIRTVQQANDALIAEHCREITAKISTCIQAVADDVEQVGGDTFLRSACISPLEDLRNQVDDMVSLAHISQAGDEAIRLKDAALRRIEEYLADLASKNGPAPPAVKKHRVIKAAALVPSPYLESQTDVEAFLSVLRQELEKALNNDERIEVR